MYSTYSTNRNSHFAYSVHTSPAKLGTNKGIRISGSQSTDSNIGTTDVARVSTPTNEIILPPQVSTDVGSSVGSRSLRSMGDLPVHHSSTKDPYNLNNNNESFQLQKSAFSDNLFHDTLSTTSANRRIKKLVYAIDNELNIVNKEIKEDSERIKNNYKNNYDDHNYKELKPEFKEQCNMFLTVMCVFFLR